jgi:subtilisin-like proprotein convertase family protein
VKSEDQQAANFGFFAISSSSPFSSTDTNGVVYMRGYPLNVEVPDGAPDDPKAGLVFAFNTEPMVVQNVVVTNLLTHEAGGDLFGVLEHNQRTSVLNANRSFSGTAEFVYDDSGSGEFADDAVTDSPGTLRNFVGEEGVGGWQLTMVDSAPFYTGQVNRLEIRLEPRSEDLTNGVGVVVTIRPGRWWRSVVDVPADATNLLVCVTQDEGPVEVYLGRGYEPDQSNFDTFATIAPPGDCLSLGLRDTPPLSQGRYFIGVFNPNSFPVTARIRAFVQRDLSARTSLSFRSGEGATIFDDATTNSTIRVTRPGLIADLSVGVRIDHERVSDLVLHLVSPSGTRVLLAENRGGPFAANFGLGLLQTNTLPVTDSGSTNAATNIVVTTEQEGILEIDYNFFQNPDTLKVYYDGVVIFDSGRVSGAGRFSVEYGPGSSTNLFITMNEQGNRDGNLWEYTVTVVTGYNFAMFTDDTNFAQVPIKFAVPPFTNFNGFITNFVTNATVMADGFEDGLSGNQTYTNLQLIAGTGWRVAIQDVYVNSGGISIAPWFILPDSGFRFLAFASTNTVLLSTNIATTPGLRYRVSFACSVGSGGNLSHVDAIASDTNGVATLGSLEIDPSQLTSSNWSRFYYDFVAIDTMASVNFVVGSGGTTGADNSFLLDTVRVDQVDDVVEAGIYFQPEEPMTFQPFGRLVGEQAFGDWTLEVTDNRVGGALTNGALLAWKLNITYVNTNPPAVTLTNTLDFCSVLQSNETAYFIVDLPLTATSVSNVLSASRNVSLIYNATGLPQGLQPPDTFFQFNGFGGTTILDGAGWTTLDPAGQIVFGDFDPQIRPGRRYFLAVRNEFPDTNAFCIRVNFDNAGLPPIISLNGTNNCRSMSNVGQVVDYFSFDVSSNSVGVEFSITNIQGGDVNLYVKRGLPLPGTNFFTQASANADPLAGEFVQFSDLSQSQLAGRWYAAVVVSGGAPSYDICAREFPGPVTLLTVNVTNGVNTISTGAVHYYKVVIASNVYLADFQTLAGASNIDLFVSSTTMSPLAAAPTNGAFAAVNGAGGDETVQLTVFNPAFLLSPGTWYLAVVNRESVPVNYSVVVNARSTNLNYIQLSSGVPYADQIVAPGAAGFYRFDVSPGAVQAIFETFNATNDVDLFIRTGFPLPPPGAGNFDFVSANGGTNSEWIALTADNPAALPAEGSYWIAVVPKAATPLPVTFEIRATEILSTDVLRLFDGFAQCSTLSPVDTNALHSGVRFFQFDVSSNAAQAGFEITSASGDVDLYVQYGLPITNYSLLLPPAFDVLYTNNPVVGGGLEAVCLLTNSGPVTLRQGTYYLAVVNRETNDVAFCVRAYELLENAIVTVSNRTEVSTTTALPVAGIDYYRYTASTSALQVIVEVIQANANVELLVDQSLCTGNFLNPAFLSTNSGTAAEMVVISPDSTNAPLVAGDWYIAVTNNAATPADYTVRVTEIRASDIVTLTNQVAYDTGISGSGSTSGPPVRYFHFNVSSNAARAQFEILLTSDDVNLIAKKDLPLPTYANAVLESSNYGTNQELIAITGSSVVALSPGDWYLAVYNASTNDAVFSVMASEFNSAGTNTFDGTPIVSATELCLSWENAVPGVYYHVDGKSSLSDSAWIPLSPTILATNTTVTYCVPLPTAYSYFRFVEGLSPKTIAPPVSFTLTSFTPSGLTLEWTAPPGTRFVAEYTETLFPPNWQPYPDYITSTNSVVTFADDGTQTAPLGPTRYYRFFEVP